MVKVKKSTELLFKGLSIYLSSVWHLDKHNTELGEIRCCPNFGSFLAMVKNLNNIIMHALLFGKPQKVNATADTAEFILLFIINFIIVGIL